MKRRAPALASPLASALFVLIARCTSATAATSASAAASAANLARVVVLDDGEKIAEDAARPMAPSVWPDPEPVDLFALRGETVAFQVVVEARATPLSHLEASLDAFASGPLAARVEILTERFVPILSPSNNAREPGSSLAFTRASAPPAQAFVGAFADPLTKGSANVAARSRAAFWIDVFVPDLALASTYDATLRVTDDRGLLAERAVRLRVMKPRLPYVPARAVAFYDTKTLLRRMGPAAGRLAEIELRSLLHAHHVSAIHELTLPSHLDLDGAALSGELFTTRRGYTGPGEYVGEGTFAIGAYGSLGDPTADTLGIVEAFVSRLDPLRDHGGAEAFVYAVDERCASPRAGAWRALLARSRGARAVRVGVTCGDDPLSQAADIVMMTSADYRPARARAASHEGKSVWVYNGQRPYAGAMVLDAPATDLRANGWIAARYGVPRWFYWEVSYWLDDGRGGRGGERGFDPFVVAETFHNADGDSANGDGILVYPGTQRGAPGMTDYGLATVFASVRLKNLRRGIEDLGYIELAREVDAARADAIVRRMVPRALSGAGERVAWPERGAAWLVARRELALLIERPKEHDEPAAVRAPTGCSVAPGESRGGGSRAWSGLFGFALLLCIRRRACFT